MSPGPRIERAKGGGGHWAELPVSLIENWGKVDGESGLGCDEKCRIFCGKAAVGLAGGLRESESVRAPSERKLTCIMCFREAFDSL